MTKTMDEVIKVMDHIEFCCTNCKLQFDCDEVECFLEDALHYLKEYRSEKAMWEVDRKWLLDWIEQYKEAREKHQQAVIELKKNPPLTWEELQQMEGKPVWFVYDWNNTHFKGWILLDHFEGIFIVDAKDEWALSEENMDKWKAYRKENQRKDCDEGWSKDERLELSNYP